MRVEFGRLGDAMAQPPGYHEKINAALRHPRSAGVAKRMRSDIGQSGPPTRATEATVAGVADVNDPFTIAVHDVAKVRSSTLRERQERQ